MLSEPEMAFDPVDWTELLAVDAPLLELVVRGSAMYMVVFVFLCITSRRSIGELSLLDFIFVVMIAVGAQNAMLGDHSSIGSGFVLVLTPNRCNWSIVTIIQKQEASGLTANP
jgi:uncharacterized membrane protein YcaP (DUF421 family)